MKKLILILTLIMGSLCFSNPDYRSSLRMFSGEIHSKTKTHKFVSLEKEFLEISFNKGLQYNISYVFKNHSNKKQIVFTTFPIESALGIYVDNHFVGIRQSFDLQLSYFICYILKLKFKHIKTHYAIDTEDEVGDSYSFESKKIKDLEDLEFTKYLSYKAFKRHFYNKSLHNSFQKSDLINLNMFKNYKFYQNGKKLKIKGVFLTLRVYNYATVFTVRFLHKMVLKPKESINVRVKYKAKSHIQSDGGGSVKFHKNIYILGTGRTWRGNIKQITVKTPYFLIPSLPKVFKKQKSFDNKHNYYLAKNYKPKAQDNILVHFYTGTHYIKNQTGNEKFFRVKNIGKMLNYYSKY